MTHVIDNQPAQGLSADQTAGGGAAGRGRSLAWAGALFGLLWTAVPLVELAGSDPATWEVALAAAGLLAFAYSFLAVVVMQRELLGPMIAMLAVTVTLTLAADDSFSLLFVFAASAAGVRLSGRRHALVVAAITALAAATLALVDPDGIVFWGITSAVMAAGALWLLIGGLLSANAALREARAELAELAVAEERLRFSRDLHDLLGHDLSLIALKAELAGKLLHGRPDRAATEVDDIRDLTRRALAQVREAVDGYRRPTLASELAGARIALEAAGIELRVTGADAELVDDVDAMLAWAVREGATNVIRHSGARHAEITVTPGDATTILEVADDGRGASAAREASGADRGRGAPDPDGAGNGRGGGPQLAGHGLAGLRERAESLGGTVDAGAGPDGGFRLRVSVPA
jgi:two-component system, NarL family, sensor histidine kinase DesK